MITCIWGSYPQDGLLVRSQSITNAIVWHNFDGVFGVFTCNLTELFRCSTTVDETWISNSRMVTKQQSKQWVNCDRSAPKETKVALSTIKVMSLSIFLKRKVHQWLLWYQLIGRVQRQPEEEKRLHLAKKKVSAFPPSIAQPHSLDLVLVKISRFHTLRNLGWKKFGSNWNHCSHEHPIDKLRQKIEKR